MKTILLWVVFQSVFSIRRINNSPNSSRKMKGWSNLMTYRVSLNGLCLSVCARQLKDPTLCTKAGFQPPQNHWHTHKCVPSFQSLPCQTSVHHFLDMDISRCVPSAFSWEPIVSVSVKMPRPDPIHTWDLYPPPIFLEFLFITRHYHPDSQMWPLSEHVVKAGFIPTRKLSHWATWKQPLTWQGALSQRWSGVSFQHLKSPPLGSPPGCS